MADKSQQLIVDALQRTAAEPGGMPLFSGKAAPGWFANNAAGKQAAQLCKDQGFLRHVRSETRGKTICDVCAVSEQGLEFLLAELNPRPVLEALVQALQNRQQQLNELQQAVGACQEHLDALRRTAARVVEHLQKANSPSVAAGQPAQHLGDLLLAELGKWSNALEDCPLPKLYRAAAEVQPQVTIGQFQDAVRQLHERQRLYLHPWTGPLYQMPEPTFALLVGHEVAYYASLRAG